MVARGLIIGAMLAFVAPPVAAQGTVSSPTPPLRRTGSEVAIGVFGHGSAISPLGEQFRRPDPGPGQFYEGEEEFGTTDVLLMLRSRPLGWALKPRLTAKAQINTGGRTSFASIGAEWRQHAFRGRVYLQGGIGLTVHDGYRFTPDPFVPGLSRAEFDRRYDLYRNRTAFGSRVLFNPNASLGIRLTDRYAVELAWEHFSHAQVFNDQNPGFDSFGVRLVRTLGR